MKAEFLAVPLILASWGGGQAVGDFKCNTGSITEQDLEEGEIALNDGDIVRVPLAQQPIMENRSGGRTSFQASLTDLQEAGLAQEEGRKWVVTRAGGFFGYKLEDAKNNFASGTVPIHASYYPSSRKVVVY